VMVIESSSMKRGALPLPRDPASSAPRPLIAMPYPD